MAEPTVTKVKTTEELLTQISDQLKETNGHLNRLVTLMKEQNDVIRTAEGLQVNTQLLEWLKKARHEEQGSGPKH